MINKHSVKAVTGLSIGKFMMRNSKNYTFNIYNISLKIIAQNYAKNVNNEKIY